MSQYCDKIVCNNPTCEGSQDALPRISLIIVVRNERAFVGKALESLTDQDYPPELLEILLVDGMSSDGTREILKQSTEDLIRRGWNVRLYDNPRLILATGWNIALREARGELVCRIDAHSELYPDYIRKGVVILRRNSEKTAGVGGVWEHYGKGLVGEAIADLLASRFAVGNSPFRTDKDKRPRFQECREADTAVYALYPKRLFEEVGYFDETLARNQDVEFHNRAKERGYTFLTCPQMRIKYHVRNTARALMKKAYSDGYWTAFLEKASFRHRVPGFFALYLICSIVIYGMIPWNSSNVLILLAWSIPLLLYLLLLLLHSVKDGNKMSRYLLLGLFPLFHLSYGVGFLKGMLVRWRGATSR